MSLLRKGQTTKPQNKFSSIVKSKAEKLVSQYFKHFGLSDYQSNLLAENLVEKAVTEWANLTDKSAPDVHFTDAQQVDRLERKAIEIGNQLDESDELEKLLADLEIADAQGEGNSL